MSGRTSIGLDIGTSGVRAAELSLDKGRATLEQFGQVALPPGAVRDGEVMDVDAVAAALRELWSRTRFSSKKVVLGVSNSKVIVRQIDLPWLPEDEFREALVFQVQDFMPMPVDQAVLDFVTLDEVTTHDGVRMRRGLLVAAARPMVLDAVAAVQRAGLKPTAVDLSSFAVLRSLGSSAPVGANGVEAVIEVGARMTNVVVHDGGVPLFVRILPMGGDDITDAVAERMGVSQAQAEQVKQQHGLLEQDEATNPGARSLDSSATSFVDEIRGSLDYYTASAGATPITRVVVSGGGALLGGLVERLATVIGLPVGRGSAMDGLAIGKTGLTPDQLAYAGSFAAVPVGLALGATL